MKTHFYPCRWQRLQPPVDLLRDKETHGKAEWWKPPWTVGVVTTLSSRSLSATRWLISTFCPLPQFLSVTEKVFLWEGHWRWPAAASLPSCFIQVTMWHLPEIRSFFSVHSLALISLPAWNCLPFFLSPKDEVAACLHSAARNSLQRIQVKIKGLRKDLSSCYSLENWEFSHFSKVQEILGWNI